jgi:hypothetical protein
MRSFVIAVLSLCACGNSSSDKLPVGGGGGTDGGKLPDTGQRPDGVTPAGPDGPLSLKGRVCLALDSRSLTQVVAAGACDGANAGGFTVTLDSKYMATTAADGTFTIGAAVTMTGSQLWHVSGTTIVDSYMFASDYEIPAILKTTYQSMLTNSGINTVPGEGAVMVQVVQNDAGMGAAGMSSSPVSNAERIAGTTDQFTWTAGTTTNAYGAAWFPGLDVGDAPVVVTAVGPTAQIATPGLPVFDGAITFGDIVFPQ